MDILFLGLLRLLDGALGSVLSMADLSSFGLWRDEEKNTVPRRDVVLQLLEETRDLEVV